MYCTYRLNTIAIIKADPHLPTIIYTETSQYINRITVSFANSIGKIYATSTKNFLFKNTAQPYFLKPYQLGFYIIKLTS